jgi:hypothetical protein
MATVTATLTDDGRNLIREALRGSSSAQVKYIAIGTSTSAPSTSDHKLGAEVLRKQVSSITDGTLAGEIIASIYIGAGDAVGVTIEEIGAFAGPSASATSNTGVLIARALYHHDDKAKTESIIGQLDIII